MSVIPWVTVLVLVVGSIVTWIGLAFRKERREADKDRLVAQTLLEHSKSIDQLQSESRQYNNNFNSLLIRMEEVGFLKKQVSEIKDDVTDIKDRNGEMKDLMHQIHLEVVKLSK